MLTAYYGLKGIPFDRSIKPEHLFVSKSSKELLSRLKYIKERRGIMVITGESGVGKTTTIRSFVNHLSSLSFKHFYAPLATVTTIDFYRQLNQKLGGEPSHFKSRLFQSIQTLVVDLYNNSKITPVIILDEAHLMKNENYQELQLITNFNMDSYDPFVIILIGQPHLADRLSRPIHKSLEQRITIKHHLLPLEKDEVKLYIDHILKINGLSKSPFSDAAIETIYKNTHGNLRLIGTLALNTMMLGVLQKVKTLTEEHVYKASQEL